MNKIDRCQDRRSIQWTNSGKSFFLFFLLFVQYLFAIEKNLNNKKGCWCCDVAINHIWSNWNFIFFCISMANNFCSSHFHYFSFVVLFRCCFRYTCVRDHLHIHSFGCFLFRWSYAMFLHFYKWSFLRKRDEYVNMAFVMSQNECNCCPFLFFF